MTPPPILGGEQDDEVVARRDAHERYSASQLLLLSGDGDAVALNGPAALVWELLRRGSADVDIIDEVAAAYRQDAAVVAPLVRDTVEQLRDHGLVTTTR